MSDLPSLDIDKLLEDLKLKHKAAAAAAQQSISLTDTIQRYRPKRRNTANGKVAE